MDWKIFWPTFLAIFVAEMGDKTQFAALAASSQTQSTFSVALAVVLALSLAGLLGVMAGKVVGATVSPEFLRWISGSLFILLGVWTLLKK